MNQPNDSESVPTPGPESGMGSGVHSQIPVQTPSMDRKVFIKKCIQHWVTLNRELQVVSQQQREFNKKIRERKREIQEQQEQVKNPILSLMSEIDTEAISIGDGMNIKSSQISNTTRLTKEYIHGRLVEYFDNGLFTKQIIRGFVEEYNLANVDSRMIDSFAEQACPVDCQMLCDYIVDVSARKIYYDDEKLTLCKPRGRKKM